MGLVCWHDGVYGGVGVVVCGVVVFCCWDVCGGVCVYLFLFTYVVPVLADY